MTEDELRTLWREHCLPLIEDGYAVVYGSNEHLVRLAKQRREAAVPARQPYILDVL